MRVAVLLFAVLFLNAICPAAAPPSTFAAITPDTRSNGFHASAVYLNDSDQPFGARFIHERSGFTLDLIEVQSVPQAFFWVNTYPTSDKGEPHTQEHLLVTKGNAGRALAASEALTLTEFTAFTDSTRTCYAFNTKAGLNVFYEEFERVLGALLHPDYTDEEVRREVRNFGVAQNPATHEYRLEEKGAVYNEMVSSTSNPYSALFRQMGLDDYGPHHPLAYNAGGEPAAIREMLPTDIRKFHDEHYFLRNMGAIVSLPKGQSVDAILAQVDFILNRAQPQSVNLPLVSEDTLPVPQPAPSGSIQLVDFPFESDQHAGHLALIWPADRNVNERQRILLNLFIDTFAGEPDTDLYRLLINSKTRKMDIGAQGLFGFVENVHGLPVVIALTNVPAANLTAGKTAEVRTLVTNELNRIAHLADGSPELAEFNTRVKGRLRDERRQLSKLVNSPPRFGARDSFGFWVDHLYRLNRDPGFHKSVTLKPDSEAIAEMLASDRNIWRDLLVQCHLTGIQPYGVVARPSSALLKHEQEARQARAAAEVSKLEARYRLSDPQATIRAYLKDYDAETARLDTLAEQAAAGKFVDNPPLTLDDQLDYRTAELPNHVPLVASRFDNMTSTTTTLALRLDTTPESDLPLLSLFPALLIESGVVIDGKPLPYEEMKQRLREEILNLDANFQSDIRTGRIELAVSAAGNDLGESRKAIEWMHLVLLHPYWKPENLPRLRDLADQLTANLREELQGPEESWVRGPMLAYAEQTHPLYLATSSLLTRIYNAERLRWMLKDAGSPQDREASERFLGELAAAAEKSEGSSRRAELMKLLAALSPDAHATEPLPPFASALKTKFTALPPGAQHIAIDAAADLSQLLPDLPDSTLSSDWSFLCRQMRSDLSVTPEKTLDRLNALRTHLLSSAGARVWMVGSETNQRELQPLVAKLVGDLDPNSTQTAHYSAERSIDRRAAQHQAAGTALNFAGFLDPNIPGGVVESMLPFANYSDTDRDALLNSLTVQLFAGHGMHTLYTKTTAVGLAYSNGIRGTTYDGWWGYYAERVPEIPQTLHFAIDVIKKQPRQPALAEYAIAQSFQETHAADTYEMRAASIADEIADGVTPDKVKNFHQALLNLRRDANLPDEIFRRVDTVYGQILPGYGPKVKDMPQALYFIIGNKKQFDATDTDLFTREDQHVMQLFPRDFWFVPEISPGASPSGYPQQ
ncbi:MAG: hypothetical protein JO211_00725 [Acidobacteriaceae bacterium]|nr:hypothetical protein [Acidobacteriaceae bacterium]